MVSSVFVPTKKAARSVFVAFLRPERLFCIDAKFVLGDRPEVGARPSKRSGQLLSRSVHGGTGKESETAQGVGVGPVPTSENGDSHSRACFFVFLGGHVTCPNEVGSRSVNM